jgi:RHS repeat-associated protein
MTGFSFTVNGAADTGKLTWNSNGTLQKMAIVDNIPNTLDTQTCTYTYDDLGRLGGQNANGYSVDCGSAWAQSFTYDPFGNISKSGSISFLPTYSAATNQFTISGANVQYDPNGNLLTDNLSNTYTWDSNWGNPASVNSTNLIYDALGRMVERQNASGNTEILYSPAGKTALMNGQTLAMAFIDLPGGGAAIYNSTVSSSAGPAYYRHSDWLGSSRLSSTGAQAFDSSSSYAPFGEQYAVSGTPDASFTGQDSDTDSTLYDFTFREYSQSQGRWISPDPAGLAAADPANPQSWNRYAYVLNNPLSFIDPLGLTCSHVINGVVYVENDSDQDGCEKSGGTWLGDHSQDYSVTVTDYYDPLTDASVGLSDSNWDLIPSQNFNAANNGPQQLPSVPKPPNPILQAQTKGSCTEAVGEFGLGALGTVLTVGPIVAAAYLGPEVFEGAEGLLNLTHIAPVGAPGLTLMGHGGLQTAQNCF